MKCAVFCLTTCAVLAAAAAAAEPADPTAGPGAGKAPDRERMAEDIEVMRRILLRALLGRPGAAAAPTSFVVTTDGQQPGATRYRVTRVWDAASGKQVGNIVRPLNLPADGRPDTHGLEGTYLKGYGVVYSMTLPLHYRDAVRTSGTSAAKPASEWDRVRRELRSGKPEADAPAGERKDPSLADIVIQALADNGRHFGELPENEQVAVAITLRSIGSCQTCHAPSGGQPGLWSAPNAAVYTTLSSVTAAAAPSTGVNASQHQAQLALVKELEAGSIQVRNLVQLGDLRMKEDRPREAAEVYQKALDQYLGFLEKGRAAGLGLTSENRAGLDEYYVKLARAYLRLGENDKALDTLKKIDRKSARKESAPVTPLPAKLVISAPRRLLDRVGQGKMTFEEFRKQATVEYRSPTPSEKTPPGSTASTGEAQTGPNRP